MSEPAGLPLRRVLHVFATFGIGGPQMRQAHLIQRMGPEVRHDIVAMDGNFAAAEHVDRARLGDLLGPPGGRSFLASTRAFVGLVRERRPDLLLTYNWGSIEACAAARIANIRHHVHHEEGFGPGELTRRHPRRDWMRRLWLARAHGVVVVSSGLLDIARAEWRVAAERLHYLPNGVDLARFHAGEPRVPEAASCILGAVGGLRAEKDHATLLAAFATMRVKAKLLLVGDGPERPRLEAMAKQLGIHDRVQFAGNASDTAPWYRKMDVFVLSSRTEQMPVSMLEAMASGLPVASTDVGDVRAMLPMSCRGALVAAGDSRGLAEALDALAVDAQRRGQEGARNRTHVADNYELDTCMARYLALYMRAARPQR